MTGPAAEARKPAILTVDDDPAVSRAVARDLRRHYGERYRIVRAESGGDALDTLKELKLRGDTVAVLVADYRMPQMSGIEFLEKAMDFFPLARRRAVDGLCRHPRGHRRHQRRSTSTTPLLQKPWDPPGEALPGNRRSPRGVAAVGARAASYQEGREASVAAIGGGGCSSILAQRVFVLRDAEGPRGGNF